jgi:hypothetical protein
MRHLKILSEMPQSWQQLQTLTADVLKDCGFTVETEKTIGTVRGKVEVDVFAEKQLVYSPKVVCECKHWQTAVGQNIVHAFRTVMNDCGASYGYIISKEGFQKGAYEAASNSNISLFSWDEFLEKFEMEWLRHVIERNYKLGREIINKKHEIISVIHANKLSVAIDMNEFYRNCESDFLFMTFKEHYLDLNTQEISVIEIDSRIEHYQVQLGIDAKSYSDYFNEIYIQCKAILREWEFILLPKTS